MCNMGVRQGENLSPVLFALFLNDLQAHVAREYGGLKMVGDLVNELLSDDDIEVFFMLYILLYVDDTIILAETVAELQRALNFMYEYCKRWNFQVNPEKSKVVIFSRGKMRLKPVFTYNDKPIDMVDDFVYLGVKFNYNGTFKKGELYDLQQANKSMYNLISKARALNLDLNLQIDLFDRIVQPVLLYGSEIGGPGGGNIVNKTQLKY